MHLDNTNNIDSNPGNQEMDVYDNIEADPYHSNQIKKELIDDMKFINQEFNNIKNDNIIIKDEESSLK